MTTKEIAHNIISALVERFEEQYSSYKNSDYNETLTRRDFIDPFFKALGWDIDNQQGFAEAYREVIHEDRVKVGDKLKAPDYSFRLSGGKIASTSINFTLQCLKNEVFITKIRDNVA